MVTSITQLLYIILEISILIQLLIFLLVIQGQLYILSTSHP
ncbi:hypothetical protein OA2633_02381 [Oceanicaulis sp. HTCC2633]|nr:hypothetical protein OA2633_02381 [Oceanicaulis sp. HTCC2633]